MKKKTAYTTIDLFAGIGGIRRGFEAAGFKTIFANDFEKYCKPTYDANSSDTKLTVGDLVNLIDDKTFDKLKFDVLLGGFPCQPFSVAGYRKGFSDQGRGNMFFEVCRILEARKPAAVMLENVKNLQGHDGGNTYKVIKRSLESLGYHVKEKVLNSAEYGGVPQNRERIFIVGFRSRKAFENFEFPNKIPLEKKIQDILEKNVAEKYYYRPESAVYDRLAAEVKKTNTVYQWRRVYVRENKSGVCPTLTANMGMGGHNVPIVKDRRGIRKLTPRECARVQGFGDDFKLPNIADSRLYKQFGNSVTVPVIYRVAKAMKQAMDTAA